MFPKKKRLIELDIPIQRNIVMCFKLIYDQQENNFIFSLPPQKSTNLSPIGEPLAKIAFVWFEGRSHLIFILLSIDFSSVVFENCVFQILLWFGMFCINSSKDILVLIFNLI